MRPRDRNVPKYGPLLAAKGKILEGNIGAVPWKIVRASDLLAEVFARLVERRDFNFA